MAIDPEEFKKRRAAHRQQQKKKKRKALILWSAAAVAAVAGIVALIVCLSAAPNKKPPSTESVQTDATAPANTVIHLAAAGDLNITEKVIAAGGERYDYTNAFMDVVPLLANADISVLNLEGNFYGAPYGADRSAPAELATALASAGVDLIQLANSYSIYKGMEGLANTIYTAKSAGLEPLGVYASAREAQVGKGYTLLSVQGIKIAFVAFTKGMDGMALPAGNAGCVNLLYTDYSTDYQSVDKAGITKILDAVSKEKPDLTVAMLHWGSEFNDTISQTQKEICALLQNNGVDAILGTHSHYVQKMEFDRQTGMFIAYSLGDFFGDASRPGSEYSVVLDLEITKSATTGQTQITNFSYTPIFTVAEEGKPLQVMRIAEAMRAFEEGYIHKISQETYNDMTYALTRISARIAE